MDRDATASRSPRRNRVDPWSDLHAVDARGMFTGNRGCVVDDHENVVRHHASQLWIICQTRFGNWRVPLARPRRWTPLFFLDDAVALAAGHRPCATCRRSDYLAYRDAIGIHLGVSTRIYAADINRKLHLERHHRGRGFVRAHDRVVTQQPVDELPDGTIVIDHGDEPRLIIGDTTRRFTFDGWTDPQPRPTGIADVLTPPTSVAALANGFIPTLHPTAED